MTRPAFHAYILMASLFCSSSLVAQWISLGPPGPVTALTKAGNVLYAGSVYGSGVFASTDNGGSWLFRSSGLTNLSVTALTAIGTTVFAGTSGAGVFVSSDGGSSWNPTSFGLISSDIGTLAAVGTTLFAGPGNFGAFMSTDNGVTWMPAGKGFASGWPLMDA